MRLSPFHRLRRVVGVVCCSFALSGQISTNSRGVVGNVSILVVDELGHEISNARIELAREGQPTDRFAIQSGKPVAIAYGKYNLEVIAPAFRTERRLLDVSRPQVWLTQQMTVWAEGESRPHSVLSGEVKSLPSDGRVWAKLVGVFNDTILESPITEGRFFLFEPRLDGAYLLMIIREGRVLDIRQVALHGYKTVQVQLQN